MPGGTTPAPFLTALGGADLVWGDIRVMPTDERLVPETSARSNARLIRETLLQGPAKAAQFIHLHEPILGNRAARVEAALPVDVLVLGMGGDMHTASLFPGAPELAAALADDAPALVTIHPAGAAGGTGDAVRAGDPRSGGHPCPDHRAGQARCAGHRAGRGVARSAVRVALTAPCPVTSTMPNNGR